LSEIILEAEELGNKKSKYESQMKDPEIIKLKISWNAKKGIFRDFFRVTIIGDYSEEKLEEIFRMFGEIHKLRVTSNKEATLSYKHVNSAEMALKQNGNQKLLLLLKIRNSW
jgi:hypothetical protein